MFLASIEANLIGLIIFAAIGVINWLAQKKQDSQANHPQPSEREVPPPSREGMRGDVNDEEERLRKFMEALGLPQNSPPPPPRPSADRSPSASGTPEAPHLPRERQRARMPRAPRPMPRNSEPPPLPPRRARSLDEADAPILPVEAISLPPLATRTLPEFDTLSSHISAIPQNMDAARSERDAYQVAAPGRSAPALPLADLLRSPDDVRRAILLREVLGSPRGLPDTEPLRSFR